MVAVEYDYGGRRACLEMHHSAVTQGISDPEFPGFYLENITRLLASDFQEAHSIVSPERNESESGVPALRSLLTAASIDEAAVARLVSKVEEDIGSSPRLAECLSEVGNAFLLHQRLQPAESYFRRGIAIYSAVFGNRHPASRSSMNSLAQMLLASGRLVEAEETYRQLIEVDDEAGTPMRATALSNFADLCRQMGRLDEALSWYHRALEAAEFTDRPGDPAVLSAAATRWSGRLSRWFRGLRLRAEPGIPAPEYVIEFIVQNLRSSL